jgi:hypothetical protein
MLIDQQHYVAAPMPFDDCIAQLNHEIRDDVYLSFPILKEIEENNERWTFTYKDLSRLISRREKRDRQLESLLTLFRGASMGDKHLIIIKDSKDSTISDSKRGYLYYKELNGTNILLEIKRNKQKWKVVKKRIARGKYITFKDLNGECVKNQ